MFAMSACIPWLSKLYGKESCTVPDSDSDSDSDSESDDSVSSAETPRKPPRCTRKYIKKHHTP